MAPAAFSTVANVSPSAATNGKVVSKANAASGSGKKLTSADVIHLEHEYGAHK